MRRELRGVSGTEDHFQALGLARKAALDSEAVRQSFQSASKTVHPDAGGDALQFEVLNRANSVLSDPAARLRHLAHLEFGRTPDPAGAVSAETMALFECVGSALAKADEFLKRRGAASSAIARALLAKDEAEVGAALMAASGSVRGRRGEALAACQSVDAALAAGEREAAEGLLASTLRELAFLGKWEAQLGERLAALLAG